MIKFAKIGLLLLVCATTIGGFLWLPPAAGFINPDLARMFVFHTPCAMAGYAASAVALWYAISYLRRRDPSDDIKSRVSFALALLFWVLTTVTGAIFARTQWGAYWNWDPRETSMFLALLICIAYFVLRAAIEEPRRQAAIGAVYAIFATVALPFLSYVLPNAGNESLHPKDVINSSGGLSFAYATVFWAQTLGMILVYVWTFQLHVALELIAVRLRSRPHEAAAAVTAHRVIRQGN